jgi:hypothetical protein
LIVQGVEVEVRIVIANAAVVPASQPAAASAASSKNAKLNLRGSNDREKFQTV